ncbi:sigma-70 family RNA polymerase sigma factor [Paenibacillus tuaregi]|uniref:sigma-70 family RNA polymerase sigma factor n=1 Tax=Paenibacillus tuaregi TaxID=1816681 RepID=UPI00083806EC|nr:sigma-70 family RNA polymerase sigma factor [Paenibacillus tuaregi]
MTYAPTRTFPDNPLLGPLSRADFITANLPLVHKVASRYVTVSRAFRVELADIIGEGSIGLINAYDRYNDAKITFGTYAYSQISGRIQNYFRDKVGDVSIPARLVELSRKVITDNLEDASPEVIAESLGISVNRAKNAAMCAKARFASPIDNVDNDASIFARVDDVSHVDVAQFIGKQPERQRQIARLLLAGKTNREIASVIGVSQGRVTQLITRLRKDCAAEFEIAA